MYDLCVIGGGAAGMATAITAARKGLSVVIIEKNEKLGKKIYATGNGKCNISNLDIDTKSNYHSSNDAYSDFLKHIISKTSSYDVIDFLKSLGIHTYNNENYIYPLSNQASSIVWAFTDVMKQLGVSVHLKTGITKITNKSTYFLVESKNSRFEAKQLVLACGGNSYSKLGGTLAGYDLSKGLGHEIIPVKPALCSLFVKEDYSLMNGVRTKAIATLYDGILNTPIKLEKGELQIKDNALSGIMIFNLSALASDLLEAHRKPYIVIDLLANMDVVTNENSDAILAENSNADSSTDFFKEYYLRNKHRTIIAALNGVVNDKISTFFSNKHGYKKEILSTISSAEFQKIIYELRNWKSTITYLSDFENAQVCSGGVDINEVNEDTYMSKLHQNLYIVGELLDIDGMCGGYNLTFAILSGIRAGENIYAKSQSN